ncbi:MAG: class I SAM-dependent methyltransferase [Candidatus Sulfotelmatobacter sp.]
MKTEDRLDYVQRYEKRLQEFGYSPATLGWGVNGRQEVRFSVLAELALRMPESSVLDVGCGFCDLYDFLDKQGWQGRYTGIDIVPGLLEVARQRHPDLDVRELDITDESVPLGEDEYDFVISSGALNAALPSGGNELHIEVALRSMFRRSRYAACVDFLSTYVDFQKPGAYHTDPSWALAAAKRLTRRVLLRHDYMPYEFSLFLFRDDAISERRVFRSFEFELTQERT